MVYAQELSTLRWFLVRAITVATIVVATVAYGTAHGAQGDVGGRPANPQKDNPRSSEIFIYTLSHGGSIVDAAQIVNNTDVEKVVKVYATDAIVDSIGAMSCRQLVEERVGVGSWIQLEHDEVTVAPRSNVVVNFTLAVPEKADVGEHNGCIVYQVKDQKAETSGNVRIETRSATRVAVTIPGNLHKNVDILNLNVASKLDRQVYSLTLKNTGNVSADTQVDVKLRGLLGGEFYHNYGQYPVLPKNELSVSYQNEKLPKWGGWYWLEGKIVYDKRPNTFGLKERAHVIEKTAGRQLIFIMPHPMVLLGLFGIIMILMSLLFFIILRRREKRDALRNWPVHTVKTGETIQSIADKQDIGWKKLAKLNGIEAPYTLKLGDKIRVPKKLPAAPRKNIKIQ